MNHRHTFLDIMQSELNPPQLEAATYTQGPLLVLAGAGSGKTRVITYRLAYLIQDCRLAPWNILALTFTNKAAREMRERVAQLLGGQPRGLWIGTFHSICARMLRQHAESLGYTPQFTIYDKADQLAAVKRVMSNLDIGRQVLKPNVALAGISQAKNRFEWPDDYEANARDYNESLIAKTYQAYRALLRENNALDFDDLLIETVRLLTENQEIRTMYAKRFQQVMVDEYQDTNHPQYLLLNRLTSLHKNICAVGDDDQSIYRWRGADIRNILDFERDFPDAKLVRLEQNYRSTRNIIEASTYLVKANQGRHDKTLWTDHEAGEPISVATLADEVEEAHWVIEQIQHLHDNENVPYGDFAIFYRINAQSRALEEECVRRSLPYSVVGGTAFYERKEIKDVLAYLRLLVNPADEVSFERIVNEPKRKLGKTSVEKLLAYAQRIQQPVLALCLNLPQHEQCGIALATRRKFSAFGEMVKHWMQSAESKDLPAIIRDVVEQSGYWGALEDDKDPQSDARLENIEELIGAAGLFEESLIEQDEAPASSLERLFAFLESVTLVSDQDSIDENEDQIRMMTVHSAKGLEFPYVFIVGLEEMIFPHARSVDSDDNAAIEEERRLCYVAMTRARQKLFISCANVRRLYGGDQNFMMPSRFISEIPEQYIQEAISKFDLNLAAFTGYANNGLEEEEADEFLPGDHVNHRSFGLGVVVEIRGEGSRRLITVDFQDVGQKTLKQEYARLNKV